MIRLSARLVLLLALVPGTLLAHFPGVVASPVSTGWPAEWLATAPTCSTDGYLILWDNTAGEMVCSGPKEVGGTTPRITTHTNLRVEVDFVGANTGIVSNANFSGNLSGTVGIAVQGAADLTAADVATWGNGLRAFCVGGSTTDECTGAYVIAVGEDAETLTGAAVTIQDPPATSGNNTILLLGGVFAPDGNWAIQSVSEYASLFSGPITDSPDAVTCADSGDANPATLTLTPATDYVQLTNSDANGCTVTMGETGILDGQKVEIVVVSNAGGTVDFADTSGVSELAAAFTAGVWDSLSLRYGPDRWVETGRSDN